MTHRDFAGFTLSDLADHDIAAQYLGFLLRERELTLLLGAGVSVGAGLPGWPDLVRRCEDAAGLAPTSGSTAAELMSAIDRVRRVLNPTGAEPEKVLDAVRGALYTDQMLADGMYEDSILENRMLIAIGALVIASSRGSVVDVFTLNFDDLLEWYLHLHGFTTQVISNLPAYLHGSRDVTVFHPHGFLPLVERSFSKSSWLVLSQQELVERLAAAADSPWPMMLGSRFMTKRLLTIGTSMQDLDINVLLKRASRDRASGDGPIGFVVNSQIGDDQRQHLMEYRLVPVDLDSHEDVPDFLLEICRIAASES